MSETSRQQLIDIARAMNTGNLNQGTGGNLSVRDVNGMLITPSGMDYEKLVPADIVWMDFDGAYEGKRNPSSEWHFHAEIYRHHPEAHAVLHAHPVSCTALACMGKGIPAFHYLVPMAGGKDIRCADYATFGSIELTGTILRALEYRKACLMAHHGLVCYDKSLTAVLTLAGVIEHLAEIYCRVLATGAEERLLDDTEMAKLVEKFSHYGVQEP